MKQLNEMTIEEQSALTEEQIQDLIAYKIAEAGILFATHPGAEPTMEPVKLTETAYEVSGVLFKTQEDAKVFQGLSVVESNYDYTVDYNTRWLKTKPDMDSVITKIFPSEEDVRGRASELKRFASIKARYDSNLSNYNKFVSKTTSIQAEVYKCVQDAKDELSEIDEAKKHYAHYLKLADGNQDVASKFFMEAYRNSFDTSTAEEMLVLVKKE